MATEQELMTALRNADKAGDAEGAQRIAAMIQAQQPASVAPPQPEPSFSMGEMVGNIPSSAMNLAGGVIDMVSSPIQTAKGIGALGAGALYKANEAIAGVMPELLDFMSQPIGGGQVFGEQYAPVAEAAGEALSGRYGGTDAILGTLQEDPVGMLADVAGLVTGAGMAARTPMLSKVGAALDPVNVATNTIASSLSAAIPSGTAASLYERAAKFSTVMPQKERAALIETALEFDLPPTSKGVAALEDSLAVIDNSLDTLISESSRSGDTIPVSAIFKELKELRQQKGGPFLEAGKDLRAINKYARELDQNIRRTGKESFTAADLQAIKRDAYQKINFNAKRLRGTPIQEDMYKAIARGAKEGVEQLVPETGALNQKMGALLELKPNLQKAAGRVENRDIIGIKTPMSAAAGASVDPALGALTGALSMLDTPKITSKAALAINRLQKTGNMQRFLDNNPGTSRARLSAIVAAESMGALDPENF